jgi:hypothetical protein
MFDLGVSLRMKYGAILDQFTDVRSTASFPPSFLLSFLRPIRLFRTPHHLKFETSWLISSVTYIEQKVPVFRTESQDRMLASEVNFAFGFFGWPLEGKYDLSVTIEAAGVSPIQITIIIRFTHKLPSIPNDTRHTMSVIHGPVASSLLPVYQSTDSVCLVQQYTRALHGLQQ